jgi:hypothetical protein
MMRMVLAFVCLVEVRLHCVGVALQVFNQSTAVQEDAGWRDNLYRMYTASSANMRVAVYGSKHDAGNYEELLRKFCAVTELVCVEFEGWMAFLHCCMPPPLLQRQFVSAH